MDKNYTETKEALNQCLQEIKDHLKTTDDRGDAREAQVDKVIDDLRGKMKSFEAAQAMAARYTPTGSDGDLADFVERHVPTIQKQGSINADAAKQGRKAAYFTGAEPDTAIRLKGVHYDDGSYESGLLDSTEPVNDWHERLLDMIDTRNMVRAIKGSQAPRGGAMDRRILRHLARAPGMVGKIFADSSGIGAEWIPDSTLPTLERTLKGARRVEALFGTLASPPGGSLILPFETTGLRPYKAGAATADDPAQFTSSSLVTANRTFTPAKLAVRAQVDRDAATDSIIAAASVIREAMVSALVDGSEDAIINGDTTATHRHTGLSGWNIRSRWGASGLGGGGDHRRLWDGLIETAFTASNTNDGSSVQTTAGILASRASLTTPHGLADNVLITSLEWYLLKMLGLAEVLTVDKFGPQATVLTGQLASILGMPVVISDFVDSQYNASGVYDDSTKTKTGYLIADPSRFRMVTRAGAAVETAPDITRGIDNWVATERKTLANIDASATKNVRWEFNLSAS